MKPRMVGNTAANPAPRRNTPSAAAGTLERRILRFFPLSEPQIAATLREIVARTGMRNCETHAKTWDLLRMTRMPAVRLDCGYLSHPVDRLLLLDARVRSAVAHAVLAAVQRLFLPAEADPATGTFLLPDKV